MTDDTVKIFVYDNKKFIEVKDTYFSKDSHHITFVNDNQIFKIENKKRKRDEYEDQTSLEKEYKSTNKKDIFVKIYNRLKKLFIVEEVVIKSSRRIIFDGNGGYRIGYL